MFWKKKEAKITVNYSAWADLTGRVGHNNRQIEELADAVMSLENKVSELRFWQKTLRLALCEGMKTDPAVDGTNCACSPIGEPHSDDCKGFTW